MFDLQRLQLLESAPANHDQCAEDLASVKEERDKFAADNERMRNESREVMAILRSIIPGQLFQQLSDSMP